MNYTRKNKPRWRSRHSKPAQCRRSALSRERRFKEDDSFVHASYEFVSTGYPWKVKTAPSYPVKDGVSFQSFPKTKLRIQSESFQIRELKIKQDISTEATTPRSELNQELDLHVGIKVRGETMVPSLYLQFENSNTIYHTPKTMTPPLTLNI